MPSTPSPRASAATVVAVLLTCVLAIAVVAYTMLGQMACASCSGATLEAFESRYWTAFVAVLVSLALAFGLLVAGRLAARRRRPAPAAVLTWLAPAVVAVAGVIAFVLIRP